MKESFFRMTMRFAKLSVFSSLLLFGAQSRAQAQDVPSEFSGLVESSMQEYLSLEQGIAEEKSPLVARLAELEQGNLELRSEVESYRFLSQEVAVEVESLTETGKALTSQVDYVRSALETFLDKFESRINVSETQVYIDDLDTIRSKVDSSDMESEFSAYAEAMRLSLVRTARNIGGEVFSGKAVDSEGRIHNGSVLVFGPTSFFSSDEAQRGGVLMYDSEAIEPGVTFLPDEQGASVTAFISTGEGELPLDSTLGDAMALQTAREGGVIAHVKQGGYVGLIIIGLGLIAAVISLLKLRDLSGFYRPDATQVAEISRLAREQDEAAARSSVEEVKGVAGEVLAAGVRNFNKNALLLEETMLSVILRAKPRMERYLPFLAITAAASPLLGLLGTVVGLIKTFALITLYGAGTPNALSSGISEALITTELGLIVAIPALILHGLFSRLIRSRIVSLEQTAFEFVESTKWEAAESK